MEHRYLFPGMLDYPPLLHSAWPGAELPILTISGKSEMLRRTSVGLLSSGEVPPDLILPSFDLALRLKKEEIQVAGGFQTEVERTILSVLLGGRGPVVLCPARSLDGLSPCRGGGVRLEDGTLAYVSAERARVHRPTSHIAIRRNDLVAGLGTRLIVLSAPPGSRVLRCAVAALEAGRRVACFDHRRNRDLLLLGAAPIRPVGRVSPSNRPETSKDPEGLLREIFSDGL